MKPDAGFIEEIDFFHFRKHDPPSVAREECFFQCLELIEKIPALRIEFSHDMLAAAAFMGLTRATQVLIDKHKLEPLYQPQINRREMEEVEYYQFRPNAIQAAIMGGYADVVKILTHSDMSLVIDEHGRTVEDYIQMHGCPIRPHYAKTILGIDVNEDEQHIKTVSDRIKYKDSGWNSTQSVPFSDTTCEFDVIDSDEEDLSFEDFLKDYYLPGRPVVLRNHISKAEVKSFSKRAWSQLRHFHPKSHHMVGGTAYPSLSMQESCSDTMSIAQIERDEHCNDLPKLHMMHAEHGKMFKEAYAMYGGDPLEGGFRKITEWFDFKASWQIFFGSDGSGATLHWHAAALNVLYVGVKEWHITPPLYRGHTGMTAQSTKKRIANEPYSIMCTQLPGDLIYIPDHWGHSTINHGFGIGVAAIIPHKYRPLPGLLDSD